MGAEKKRLAFYKTGMILSVGLIAAGFLFGNGLLTALALMMVAALFWCLIEEMQKREALFLRDNITGGYNREGFLVRSRDLIDGKNYASCAVVFLNVIDFRYINESWGEEEGNRTLRFLYRKLTASLDADEIGCRSGMDHFFLLLQEPSDEKVSERVGQILEDLNGEAEEEFTGWKLSFRIGVSRLKENGGCAQAMNRAIRASVLGNQQDQCVFYCSEIERREEREKRMDELFEESIRNHDFEVYLQPKIDLTAKKRCSAEALVRWSHPLEGLMAPGEFIPLFEKNGKICRLDMYMLEEVCRLVSDWIRQGKTPIGISVNLSRFHLRNAGMDIWRDYKRIKEQYRIPDGLIEIELTETALLESNQLAFVQKILEGFRSCGFEVSLDDFGFAYSSLALLKAFEVDTLKLDREFFVGENIKSQKIVGGIIQLAHSLNMRVVAEGIESQEQVEMLRSMNCDMIQGYVYSEPLPVGKFEIWRDSYCS